MARKPASKLEVGDRIAAALEQLPDRAIGTPAAGEAAPPPTKPITLRPAVPLLDHYARVALERSRPGTPVTAQQVMLEVLSAAKPALRTGADPHG